MLSGSNADKPAAKSLCLRMEEEEFSRFIGTISEPKEDGDEDEDEEPAP